jgi:D-3-phosphoglycerate dehydrogenase
MTAETRHFLGKAELAAMKRGAMIINTGRGPTIDNRALHAALAEGHIAAAGLDDLEEEPAKREGWIPSANPLLALPNVIVTPHAAYYSEESIRLARETAANEVARVLRGEAPRNPVNNVRLASGAMSLPSS